MGVALHTVLMDIQPAVVAENLSVWKDKNQVLHDLSFEIEKGKVTGLIGPSGAGKTTLMRAIVGLQLLEGRLDVLGSSAGTAQLRSKIGYVTQSPAVYDDLTVAQNLKYFAAILRAKNTVDKVIGQVDLLPQKNQLVASLSGGQKARVSLAVALLGNPELLVLDEPTVGLDPVLRRDLWNLFADLASQGKTLLISSHVMDEADRCDNVLLLRDGGLLWQKDKVGLLQATKARDVETAFLQLVEREEK
jgi:ABC-2 type transport system ATP-binding protein